MKKILFDAHAILKFYQDESGADEVEKYLLSSQRGDSEAYMSEINLGEVYYKAIRRIGLAAARELLDEFSELPIHVILPSREIILLASEIKAEYAISYADCFAVATAEKVTASIITGDPEFKKVEHLVEIIWI
jgi:predicted nucleic acid-binding protein